MDIFSSVSCEGIPHFRGVVFDLPNVIEPAREAIHKAGVTDRCDVEAGNLFQRVPAGADVYVLSSILHDWPDDRVLEALRIVRAAMTGESRLLVIDCLLPEPGDESDVAQAQVLDDMNMLVRTGGRGRRESELRELFMSVGLQVTNVLALEFARSLVEGMRRA